MRIRKTPDIKHKQKQTAVAEAEATARQSSNVENLSDTFCQGSDKGWFRFSLWRLIFLAWEFNANNDERIKRRANPSLPAYYFVFSSIGPGDRQAEVKIKNGNKEILKVMFVALGVFQI